MGWLILAISSMLLFAVSAHCMAYHITHPVNLQHREFYSLRALRIERGYKILAWGLLTAFLFYTFAVAFFQAIFV